MAAARLPAAVVLSGCGVYDGAEIHESVSMIIHLSQLGVPIHYYAPDRPQRHVINHTAGAPTEETRNCMVEAARIARGDIRPLATLPAAAAQYSAAFYPGGFGVAKNLADWAVVSSKDYTVESDAADTLKAFHALGKPQAFSCIAPILPAKVIPGATITLGGEGGADGEWPYAGVIAHATESGAVNKAVGVGEVVVDEKNKVRHTPFLLLLVHTPHLLYIMGGMMFLTLSLSLSVCMHQALSAHQLVTTPAYMYGPATPAEVFDGIGKAVRAAYALADAQ